MTTLGALVALLSFAAWNLLVLLIVKRLLDTQDAHHFRLVARLTRMRGERFPADATVCEALAEDFDALASHIASGCERRP